MIVAACGQIPRFAQMGLKSGYALQDIWRGLQCDGTGISYGQLNKYLFDLSGLVNCNALWAQQMTAIFNQQASQIAALQNAHNTANMIELTDAFGTHLGYIHP